MTRSQKLAVGAVALPIALLAVNQIVVTQQDWDTTGGWGQFAMMVPRVLAAWVFFLGMTAAALFARPESRLIRVVLGWMLLALACVYLIAGGLGFLGLAFWVAPYLGTTLIVFLPVSLVMFYILLRPSFRTAYAAEQERIAKEGPFPRRKKVLWVSLTFGAIVVLFVGAGALAELADAFGAQVISRIISYGFAIFMLIGLGVSLTYMYLHWQARTGSVGSKAGRLQ